MKTLSKKGFTLIELLVVIAIISVLAAIVVYSAEESRAKARASHALQQIQQIETALNAYKYSENLQAWWSPGDGTGYHNDQINQLRTNVPTFDSYIGELPESRFLGGNHYEFRNNGVDYSCGVHSSGISIRVENAHLYDSRAVQMLDNYYDNGDGADCGTVRWGGSSESLYWRIADSTDDT